MGKRKRSRRRRGKRGLLFYVFPGISLIIAACCISYIYTWYTANGANNEVISGILNETTTVVDDNTGEKTIDFAKLKEKNSDVVGWLKVNGTTVDYPVVQAADNDYYLTHNFNKEDNIAGWVFADYRLDLDGTDKNIIIYGHNMKDGSMFGSLKKSILTENWYNNEENLVLTYETERGQEKYRVFSVYEIPDEVYYTKVSFSSDEEYQSFLDTMKSRSKKDFGVTLTAKDRILTLSTCASNDKNRVVLQAVRVAN